VLQKPEASAAHPPSVVPHPFHVMPVLSRYTVTPDHSLGPPRCTAHEGTGAAPQAHSKHEARGGEAHAALHCTVH